MNIQLRQFCLKGALMNKVHYTVSGLVNEQMKTQIKNVLNEVDGVNMVNIDLGKGSIEIGFNDTADERKIKEGIERVGCKIEY